MKRKLLGAALILLFLNTVCLALDWIGGDQTSIVWIGEPQPTQRSQREIPTDRNRILLFLTDNCPPCTILYNKLSVKNGPFDKLRLTGWDIGQTRSDDIQIVYAAYSQLDERYNIGNFPALVKIEDGRVVRRLLQDCGTVIDQWAIGWLHKGVQEQPPAREPPRVATTGHYPIHGQRWNFEGSWSPTKSFMIKHLLSGSAHRGKFHNWNLQSWSKAELWSLHDDDHEGRVKRRTRKTASVKKSAVYCPT